MRSKLLYLPKPLYEILPVLYLSLGTVCVLAGHSVSLDILGAFLLSQGLFNSILRINYRSPQQALSQSPLRRRGR